MVSAPPKRHASWCKIAQVIDDFPELEPGVSIFKTSLNQVTPVTIER